MLKIKDNVDLKELGFEENKNLRTKTTKTYIYKDTSSFSDQYYYDFEFIVENGTNKLILETSAYGLNDYDLIGFAEIFYDLIQAGLVEKVVEE